jgi:gamma-glutamyltranspeptidase/glutathione hydrolase
LGIGDAMADLATHATRVEQPVSASYRGYTIYKCGPWTQGPYLLQALRLLECFDVKKSGFQTAATIHLIVEAMKLALADRDTYYGDPLFVQTPLRELLSDEYTKMRQALIDPAQASMEQRPGDPLHNKALLDKSAARFGLSGKVDDTTTCLTADKWGNVVAATPSGWQGREVGNTGIWLGSRLISFNVWKGHPNCIEPGKRPRITLTPTIVLKDGKPALAVSVAGGDTQDQATLQIITNYIDFGLPADKLVRTPRYATDHFTGSFCQTPPVLGRLNIEKEMGADMIAGLKKLGHDVPGGSVPSWRICITFDPAAGTMHSAGDPGANRHAFAF